MRHNFCLAFPGDGWSSRVLKKTEKTPAHTSTFVTPHSPPADDLVFQVLDALVHGCIPVIVQDESDMFFEGAFREAGLAIEYADFSVRLAEAQLPQLVQMLLDIPRERVVALRRTALWVCTPPKTSCLPASPARLPGPPPRPASPARLPCPPPLPASPARRPGPPPRPISASNPPRIPHPLPTPPPPRCATILSISICGALIWSIARSSAGWDGRGRTASCCSRSRSRPR